MRLIDVGGRLVELEVRRSNRVRGSRIVVRPGYPPELVVRPRAGEAEVDAALNEHLPWLERQLARTPEARLGLDRLRLTEAQGRREAQRKWKTRHVEVAGDFFANSTAIAKVEWPRFRG